VSDARVFIGSPAEAIKLANALQTALERDASARVWSQRIFPQNRGTLESLLEAADTYDFACFIAPPHDVVVASRGSEHAVTRDNVILEYGLFLGHLGPDRVFLIRPRDSDLTLPSDLAGVSHLDYKPVDKDNPPAAVLSTAAQVILDAIEEFGPRESAVARRYSPVLERGSVDRVAGVSDAALYFSRKRSGYRGDLRQLVLQREVIPGMYYYATDEGAEFWLEMSSDPRYRFKNNSIRLIRKTASAIAETVLDRTPRNALDFISLGSGDGDKDQVLLGGFDAADSPSIIYYPLDISDKLLVECIRTVQRQAYDYAGFKTKAIIGDFIDLRLLRSVYEDRPSPNLFSLLGNTFGNTDEARIMNALRDSMYPGDFVLVEINCDLGDVDAPESILRNELTLRYSCVPISLLGIPVDLKMASVRPEEDLSVFQCAKSTATYYSQVTLDDREVSDVPLAFDHRYRLGDFKDELAEYLDVEVLFAEQYGNAALVLAQKNP
jgi:hypothetical protein